MLRGRIWTGMWSIARSAWFHRKSRKPHRDINRPRQFYRNSHKVCVIIFIVDINMTLWHYVVDLSAVFVRIYWRHRWKYFGFTILSPTTDSASHRQRQCHRTTTSGSATTSTRMTGACQIISVTSWRPYHIFWHSSRLRRIYGTKRRQSRQKWQNGDNQNCDNCGQNGDSAFWFSLKWQNGDSA